MHRLLVLLPLALASYQFDNALTGTPKIECGHDHVALAVSTAKDMPAHIFTKGHFKKDGCSYSNTTHIVFDFNKCDANRKREANPRGMSYSMTIVVQLHPLFVTKVDRMFHVRCFYQETDKGVGVEIPLIKDLPTEDLGETAQLPVCNYTLHKDSANGPIVKYANVGDLIYHVWDCPSDIYAMMVHSCSIADGSGNQFKILDEDGCTLETYLMPALTYSNSLSKAITASNAFLIPDQTSVFFNCQIRYCVKGTDTCNQITPPRCGGTKGEPSPSIDPSLDEDQLITVPSTPATIRTTGSTTPSATTTTPTTTMTSSPSTTARATTTPIPSTTTASAETTTVVTTTVTEITTTTTGVPTSSILILAKRFPTPQTLLEMNKSLDDAVEGSGMEIAPTTKVHLIVADQVSHEKVYLRPGDVNPPDVSADSNGKRELKRRDTVVDVDISSPEVTFVDKEFGIPEAPEALRQEKESRLGQSVCVPLVGFWAVSALCAACMATLAGTICYAQRQRNKFRMLP